jgi:hypothetical protein
MGRTFLDIDMARAADLLGMERRQAEAIRDLQRGTFLGLGPAIARRPVTIRIGAVETAARSSSPKLVPLPDAPVEDMRELLLAQVDDPQPSFLMAPAPPPPPPPARAVLDELARHEPVEEADEQPPENLDAILGQVLRAIAEDAESANRPAAVLYQDFQVRCRMAGVRKPPLEPSVFARRLAAARAGIVEGHDGEWAEAIAVGATLPDDMLGPFLLIARAAREGAACPDDETVAQVYGTSSLGRARRMLGYMEKSDLIVTRVDLSGRRSITIPKLGWTTAAAEAE